MINFREKARFIWDIADLLRGNYRQADYGKVILPLTVLRRFDCVLAPTKEATLKRLASLEDTNVKNIDPILNRAAGQSFHNKSPYDFEKLKADPNNIAANLFNYINSFSAGTPGSYNFQWRMVQEGVEWFGAFTPNVLVNVTGTTGCSITAEQSCYNRGPNYEWDPSTCRCIYIGGGGCLGSMLPQPCVR